VPADAPRKIARAWASGADAIILDLEDAVAPEAKDAARAALRPAIAARPPDGPLTIVRINPPDEPHGLADLDAVAAVPVDGILVPKADLDAVRRGAALAVPIVALLETAAGIVDAERIASAGIVSQLMFGPVDLAAELGCDPDPGGPALLLSRSRLVLASAAGHILPPIDGPTLDFSDLERVRADSHSARRLGYGAKACIHPDQLPVVAETFAPSADDVAWARAVIEVYERALTAKAGVVSLNGTMVDAPVVRRAYAMLSEAADTHEYADR
jgi:citrate lyase subunit beta/citryl-CoA lyase